VKDVVILERDKVLLEKDVVGLKYGLRKVHCCCLLEMVSKCFTSLHKTNKSMRAPGLMLRTSPQVVPLMSAVLLHVKVLCFDLYVAGFPHLHNMTNLWRKLSQMVLTFSGGMVYILAGLLINSKQDLVALQLTLNWLQRGSQKPHEGRL
jgi:hypothetical protein